MLGALGAMWSAWIMFAPSPAVHSKLTSPAADPIAFSPKLVYSSDLKQGIGRECAFSDRTTGRIGYDRKMWPEIDRLGRAVIT